MKKLLLMSLLFALTVGCVTPKVDILVPAREYTKREYKENRFTGQFQKADSMFNEKYKF